MSLGGLIPIGGGGGGSKKGSSNADLTGGLISIGGNSRAAAPSDDFDMDDLLLDDTSPIKPSKSSSKSGKTSTGSPKSKSRKSSSSSKSKDKDKSRSKKKDKDKSDTSFDMEEWDKSRDSDSLPTPPVRKKTGLDAEFARMLGLEDEFAAGDDASQQDGDPPEQTEMQAFSPLASPEPPSFRSFRDASPATVTETPGQGSGATTNKAKNDDDDKDGVGGLDATFFLSEGDERPSTSKEKDKDSSSDFLSFLSSTGSSSERRGRGGGRRGGGGGAGDGGSETTGSRFADPFANAGATKGGRSTFESLFGGSNTRSENKPGPDPVSETLAPTEEPPRSSPSEEGPVASRLNDDQPTTRSSRRPSETPKDRGSAKEDLLAELFAADPEPTPMPAAAPAAAPTPPLKAAPASVADDSLTSSLLDELLPREGKLSRSSPPAPTQAPDEEPPKPKVQRTTPAASSNTTSARDSLLMDLLGGESPPQPSRAASTARPSITQEPSPPPTEKHLEKLVQAEQSPREPPSALVVSPDRESTEPSPRSTKPRESKVLTPEEKQMLLTPEPPAERGKPKTLSPPKPPKPDFEQTKDSLLEELFAGEPSETKPPSVEAESPPLSPLPPLGSPERHRNSNPSLDYSMDDFTEQAEQSQSYGASPSPRRRSSLSPVKSDQQPSSPPSPFHQPPASSPVREPPPATQAQSPLSPPAQHSSVTPPMMSAPAQASTPSQSPVPALAPVSMPQPPPAAVVAPNPPVASFQPPTVQHDIDALVQPYIQQLRHAEEQLSALHAQVLTLTQQLHSATARAETLASDNLALTSKHQFLEQQQRQWMEQAATLAHEKETLTQQYAQASALAQALQAQEHAWQTERATLMNHARSLEDAQRELTLSLSREKQDHALTQARFSAFQQQQEHEATAQRQRDTQQMEKVYLQLQRSLTSLQVLQEHVVDEELTKQQVESATRLRMITSLESSSRQCARQTEEECQRLSSLLGALESTLRHARQEQLDERERLRQEQHRLTALAAHFQAQTSVLHEKSDANAQMLTQYFATSMQDTRMAEARVFQRRQALEDEERKLYDERARFAAYREETLREQQREQTKLQQERERLDTQWQRLRQERDDLDEVIASHEDEFAELQRAHQALQDEKASIALGAEQVAAMAAKCEALTQQLVAREEALKQQQEALNAVRQQAQTKDERLRQDKHKLDERETRLHTQLKQMERARQQLNDERRARQQALQHMQQRAGTRYHPALLPMTKDINFPVPFTPMPFGRGDNQVQHVVEAATINRPTTTGIHSMLMTPTPVPSKFTSSVLPVMSDPSGLSPAMRQLVEENWKKRSWDLGLADAAVHKERMLINCLGLDKPVAPTPSTTASTMPSTSKPWERHHGKTSNSRAQYSATKASNWMPTSSQRTSPPSPSPPSVSSSQPTAPPAPPRAAPLAAPSALRRPSPVVSIEL